MRVSRERLDEDLVAGVQRLFVKLDHHDQSE